MIIIGKKARGGEGDEMSVLVQGLNYSTCIFTALYYTLDTVYRHSNSLVGT
jgi:hypothetical protein